MLIIRNGIILRSPSSEAKTQQDGSCACVLTYVMVCMRGVWCAACVAAVAGLTQRCAQTTPDGASMLVLKIITRIRWVS